MQTSGTLLEPSRQLKCYQLYQENAYAYACLEFLKTKLVENGILVTRGEQVATPEFEQVVDRYYQMFVKDALISIMVYGFVAWDTQIVDRFRVPVVLPGTHVRVNVSLKQKEIMPVYTATYTMTNSEIPFFDMVYAPDLVNMVIDSPLCKVLPYHIFEIALLQNAARADRRNADTPLVLENTAANPGFWAMKNLETQENEIGILGFH